MSVGLLSGHPHQDWGSFLLSYKNHTFIQDSGTYSYHRCSSKRQYFRSFRAHSTCTIDEDPPGRFIGKGELGELSPFSSNIESTHTHIEDEVKVSHDSFPSQNNLTRQTRIFHLSDDSLEICDTIEGTGNHEIEIRFPLVPSVEVLQTHANHIILKRGGVSIAFDTKSSYCATVIETPYSEQYLS